jgi:formylmethanofuran dehydrogenase subunit E
MTDRKILEGALQLHGHGCWACTVGVRAGLATLAALGAPRSGGTQLCAIVEIGEDHGGTCFADGVQYATGCTFGKDNLRRQAYGKLAVTLVDKATQRAVRASYWPALHKQVMGTAFVHKRGMGIMPDEIPASEQEEVVNLIWEAPETEVLHIGPVFLHEGEWLPEMSGMTPCAVCCELVANAYLRVVGNKHVCIACSGYER